MAVNRGQPPGGTSSVHRVRENVKKMTKKQRENLGDATMRNVDTPEGRAADKRWQAAKLEAKPQGRVKRK
jgi:hypothetical protein